MTQVYRKKSLLTINVSKTEKTRQPGGRSKR